MRRIRHPSTKTMLIFAALFVLVLALGAFANAADRKTVKINAPTEIGGTVLQPGTYTVRKVDTPGGLAIEFVRELRDPTVPDGARPDEVVSRVEVCEQPLSAPAKHTQLQVARDASSAVGLEIRDEVTAYLFASPRPGAMATGAETGCAP